jgi:hypothetical protein
MSKVLDKINEQLNEANLPKGAKKINSRLSYVVVKEGGATSVHVYEKTGSKWTAWWVLNPEMFSREFGIKV